jgi:hypothetical protein
VPRENPDGDEQALPPESSLDLPSSWMQLFTAPRFEDKEHIDLSV